MMIDKLARHLYKRNLGEDETYSIIDPMMFLDDIYVDLTLSKKIADEIYELYDAIDHMGEMIEGSAPVYMISEKQGEVKLFKSDIKKLPDYSDADGLDRVDNTSDAEKQPSEPFKKKWMQVYSEQLLPMYNQMVNDIYPYQLHVSGDGNTPLKNNPHRTLLSNGIYYGDDIIILDPDKFLHAQYLWDAIEKHNQDLSLMTHPVIQNITMPSIGGNPPGTLYQQIQALSDREDAFRDSMNPIIEGIVLDLIGIHNIDPNAHPYLHNRIREMYDSLSHLDDPVENPLYEYQRYKIDVYNPSITYTREYPSTKMIYTELKKIRSGVSFMDRSNIPAIVFSEQHRQVYIRDSRDMVSIIPINSMDPNSPKCKMYIDYNLTDFSSMAGERGPQFIILAKPPLIGWIEDMKTGWKIYKLNIDPKDHPFNITKATIDPKVLTDVELKSKYPNINSTHLSFSEYDVVIYHRRFREVYEVWHAIEPHMLIDTIVTTDPNYRNPETRVLFITTPANATTAKTTNIQMQSFDLSNTPVQSTPIPFGHADKVKTAVSEPVRGVETLYTHDEILQKWVSYGMTIDSLAIGPPGNINKMKVGMWMEPDNNWMALYTDGGKLSATLQELRH